tara:strand:+ start:392 stop:580 length:189 start_codon:yes stop_codon:yes gene_type:complete
VGKTTRLPQDSKEKRYASQYAQGGLNKGVDAVTATAEAHNRPKVKKVAATGDKFNTYKTRIT